MSLSIRRVNLQVHVTSHDSRHDKHEQAVEAIYDECRSRSFECACDTVEASTFLMQKRHDETQHGMQQSEDSAED